MSNGLRRGKLLKRAGLVILMGACAMLMSASQAPATVVSALHPSTPAPMPIASDSFLHHTGTNGGVSEFNHFDPSGTALTDAGFTTDYGSPVASLMSLFTGPVGVSGSILSEVYRHSDGHLLFVYTISNDGTESLNNGNLVDVGCVEIIDSGELHGSTTFVAQKDYRIFERDSAEPEKLAWFWRFIGVSPQGGELGTTTSRPLYIEVDVPFWTRGDAAVIDGGTGAQQIPVLVPTCVPEPLTMLGMFLGLGSVGAYIRKRRMA